MQNESPTPSAPVTGRYDRQLRLWGAWGQNELEKAYLLFLGCHPLWVEALESLAASGLQDYMVVDDQLLTQSDLNEYFCMACHADHIGHKPRSELIISYMLEINPVCSGSSLLMSPKRFTERICNAEEEMLSFLSGKIDGQLIIIGVNQPISLIDCLRSTFAREIAVSAFNVFSVGPFGSIRMCSDYHFTWNTRSVKHEYNLCLECPFPRLRELAENMMNSLASKDLATEAGDPAIDYPRSIPYVILLMRLLRLFIDQNQKHPKARDRTVLESLLQSDEFKSNTNINPECIEEAAKHIYRLCQEYEISDELKAAFVLAKTLSPSDKNRRTIILFNAIEKFYLTQGRLPVSNSIPDMISESDLYLAVRQCYQTQYEADFEELKTYMEQSGWSEGWELMKSLLEGLDVGRLALTVEASGTLVSLEEVVSAMNDVCETEMITEMEAIAEKGSLGWDLSYGDQKPPSVCTVYVCIMAMSRLLEYRAKNLAAINTDSFLDLIYKRLQEELKIDTLNDHRTLIHFKQCYSLRPQQTVMGILGGTLAGEILKTATRAFLPLREQIIVWDSATSKAFSFPFWSDGFMSVEL